MNEQIEDERGLMKLSDFKKMLYTSFNKLPVNQKEIVFEMIASLISTTENDD
jgi:hypothetical protein